MLELAELSRIGFGAYRTTVRSAEHRRAMVEAFRAGCNLVDTSSNYMGGESEALVGEVGAAHPELKTFVITKAGYAQGENLAAAEALERQGRARGGVFGIGDGARYSIHPDFLRDQLDRSLARLRRTRVDGFLLHNPEHYFARDDGGASRSDYYARIGQAFAFLEGAVEEGKIRYYGISSNTLPLPGTIENSTNLRQVLAEAQRVSTSHHFRFVQFPFNLLEQGALEPDNSGETLLDVARFEGLTTFANRPLNARGPEGEVRIATYEQAVRDLDEARDGGCLDECIERIARQLERLEIEDDPMELTVLQFLRSSWTEIATPELVEDVFRGHFYPLVEHLYAGAVPLDDAAAFRRLHAVADLYSRRRLTKRAAPLRRRLVECGAVSADDERPLALLACEQYLAAGIDHVLAGMRRTEYVELLKPLFQAS